MSATSGLIERFPGTDQARGSSRSSQTRRADALMRTFHLLVANTLVASVINNFLWFALTFWVYLETRAVLATAIIGSGYMLLVAVSGMFFGTFVDRHLRRTSILLSSAICLTTFTLAGLLYAVAPGSALRDLGHHGLTLMSVEA
jgi:MFS family permease